MSDRHPPQDAAWVHGHAHEPNPLPPDGDGGFVVFTFTGSEVPFSVAALAELPYNEVAGCFIVSTGHGTSGPFTFGGARLEDVLAAALGPAADLAQAPDLGQHGLQSAARQAEGLAKGPGQWDQVDVVSADGFGTRLAAHDVAAAGDRPILLAYRRDGQWLERADGLVRLVVPNEHDDALRQVKWVARIDIYAPGVEPAQQVT